MIQEFLGTKFLLRQTLDPDHKSFLKEDYGLQNLSMCIVRYIDNIWNINEEGECVSPPPSKKLGVSTCPSFILLSADAADGGQTIRWFIC